jgi:NifU-like protein
MLRHRRRDDRGHGPRQRPQDGEEVTNYTKAGGGCSACHEKIEEILIAKVNGRTRAEAPKKSPPAVPGQSPVKPKLTNYQRIRKIEDTLEAIRPMLQRDHGDVELVRSMARRSTST